MGIGGREKVGVVVDLEVFVADEQDAEQVDTAAWAGFLRSLLIELGIKPPAEVSLLFVDEESIASLHERFLGLPGPTDVLSFPLDGEILLPAPGATGPIGYPSVRSDEDDEGTLDRVPLALGDIVICPAVAARQAPEHAGTFADEIALLLVHGTLHLLGHDHAEPEERAVMQARERSLLAQCWRSLARDPWAVDAGEGEQ